jgi:hypothetical protein
MNRRVLVSSRILIAAAVLLAAVAAGAGPAAKLRVGKRPAARPGTFSLSASYSGYLRDSLRIGGVEYRLSPTATIYVVGTGVVEPGLTVSNAYVYLSGRRQGGAVIVDQVIVRDRGTSGSPSQPEKGSVGVLPAGSPS